MKKFSALILSLLLLFCFAACANETADNSSAESTVSVTEKATVRIAGLKGPTSMGMVKLISDSKNGVAALNYDFTMAVTADEITPKLVKGELDVAAVPANLASVLFNNTKGDVRVIAVNTLGVVYIAEKGNSVNSVEDLKGKTVYATGKGSTPEYALKYILSQNGLDPETDVTIEWKSEPTEVVGVMASKDEAIAMLPQPFVTVAQGKVEGLRVALDLNKEWEKLDNGSLFITGVLVAKKDFVEKNPELVATMLSEYEASTKYVNENVADAAALVGELGIVDAAVAEKAIPFCNIVCIKGDEMKTAMNGYLKTLYDQNPKAVGGALPEDDFYFKG